MSASVLLLCMCWPLAARAPVDVESYLRDLGLLPVSRSATHVPPDLTWATSVVQAEFGLPPTGKLDNDTRAVMGQFRCGVTPAWRSPLRARRYLLVGSRWRKAELTYKITRYHSELPHADVDAAQQEAADNQDRDRP